ATRQWLAPQAATRRAQWWATCCVSVARAGLDGQSWDVFLSRVRIGWRCHGFQLRLVSRKQSGPCRKTPQEMKHDHSHPQASQSSAFLVMHGYGLAVFSDQAFQWLAQCGGERLIVHENIGFQIKGQAEGIQIARTTGCPRFVNTGNLAVQ